MRQVHPDLFSDHQDAQHANTESLKALNAAIKELQGGGQLAPLSLSFYVRDDFNDGPSEASGLQEIRVKIRDSLMPLYQAFDLITDAEAEKWHRKSGRSGGLEDANFLEWLRATVKVCRLATALQPRCPAISHE
jgi:hypothetical protein